jgi:ribosome maturation factor RimP
VPVSTLKAQIWEFIEPIVSAAGCQLFDLDAPGGPSGVLRIFIWKGQGAPVLLDDCASVSKRLEDLPELDEMIPGSYVLEVSSPGVNRKLTRPEHFSGAVGERIKLVTEEDGRKGRSLRGKLTKCEGGMLEVQDEESKGAVQVNLSQVKRAQVDFQFGNG